MAVICYLLVIIVWSTTPLAIKLSNNSVAPLTALNLRFMIAVMIGLPIIMLWRRKTFFQRSNYKSYMLASIAMSPNMVLVYFAANYIPSGLIAVLFGLSPMVVGAFGHYLLNEPFFTPRKIVAQLLAIIGLILIFTEQLHLGEGAIIGIVLMLVSLFCHSYSLVAVKRRSNTHPVRPFDLAIGAMLVACCSTLPISFLLAVNQPNGLTILIDNVVAMSHTSTFAILYLGLIGSLLGVICFYYVVNHMAVQWAAVIPMITPIIALYLGAVFQQEQIAFSSLVGSFLILIGLAIYQVRPNSFWQRGHAKWLRIRGLN